MLGKGIAMLAAKAGATTGEIERQQGGSVSWTGGLILDDDRRDPQSGRMDRLARTVVIPFGSIAAEPKADDRLTFTGEARVWRVQEVTPVSAGGTVTAWQITLDGKSKRTTDTE